MAGDIRRFGLREIRDVVHARTPTHLHLRDRLIFLAGATLVIDAIASVLILLFDQFVLDDTVPPLRWAGVAFIGIGIILVSQTGNS